MEFFRLGRLKSTLLRGPLPTLETAKYLGTQAALWSLIVIPLPAEMPTAWTFMSYPVLSLLGVYYCCRRHGGASGERFAERYLATGWVVGLRVAAALILLLVVGVGGLALANSLEWLEGPRLDDVLDIGTSGVIAR